MESQYGYEDVEEDQNEELDHQQEFQINRPTNQSENDGFYFDQFTGKNQTQPRYREMGTQDRHQNNSIAQTSKKMNSSSRAANYHEHQEDVPQISDDLQNRFFNIGKSNAQKYDQNLPYEARHRYEDFGPNGISNVPIPAIREQSVYDDFPGFQNQKHLNKIKNHWELRSHVYEPYDEFYQQDAGHAYEDPLDGRDDGSKMRRSPAKFDLNQFQRGQAQQHHPNQYPGMPDQKYYNSEYSYASVENVQDGYGTISDGFDMGRPQSPVKFY